MKKLIFGLALLLVSIVSLFVITNETNDVTEDNNDKNLHHGNYSKSVP